MASKFDEKTKREFRDSIKSELKLEETVPTVFRGAAPVMGQALPAGFLVDKNITQIAKRYCALYQWYTENSDEDVEIYPALKGGTLRLITRVLDMETRDVIDEQEKDITSGVPGEDIGKTMHDASVHWLWTLCMKLAEKKALL